MKYQEALNMIEAKEFGFMVHFERVEGHMQHSDMFPDKHGGEDLIETEYEAWEIAERFAKAAPDNYINIYVINHKFSPVAGYESKKLRTK